jgi:hypothetical protein
VLHFVRPAALSAITISTGPKGSSFARGDKLRQGVREERRHPAARALERLLENLSRLADPASDVDVDSSRWA